MKYVTPRYEQVAVEIKDIITASSDKYEVEQNNNGSGKITLKASDLFR